MIEGNTGMPIYRRRPEFVEALLVLPETAQLIANWTHGEAIYEPDGRVAVEFETQTGQRIRVPQDMYVIRTQENEWKTMTLTEFAGRYELL